MIFNMVSGRAIRADVLLIFNWKNYAYEEGGMTWYNTVDVVTGV